jgi:hypothetical protein
VLALRHNPAQAPKPPRCGRDVVVHLILPQLEDIVALLHQYMEAQVHHILREAQVSLQVVKDHKELVVCIDGLDVQPVFLSSLCSSQGYLRPKPALLLCKLQKTTAANAFASLE